jgi:hypothetical protein
VLVVVLVLESAGKIERRTELSTHVHPRISRYR